MAIYTVNDVLSTGDVVRTTRRFSSAQSLNRAGKNGHTYVLKLGRMHFTWQMPDKVAAFHNITTWDGLNVMGSEQLPTGLRSLRSVGKKAKVSPERILIWAAVNRLNVYWVGGHFFVNLQEVMQITVAEQKRMNTFTIPPKVRRNRIS